MIPANLIHDSFNVPSLAGLGDVLPSAPMYPIPANSVITAWKAAGMAGLGLFDTPADISTWGVAEWAVVLVGTYVGVKLIGDVSRAGKKVGKVRRRSAKRKRLKEELANA